MFVGMMLALPVHFYMQRRKKNKYEEKIRLQQRITKPITSQKDEDDYVPVPW
jgi:hypothetical protein